MTEAAAWRVVARGIVLFFGIVLLGVVVRELRTLIVQVLLAVLLAAAASPVVDALASPERAPSRRVRPPRPVAAILVFLAGLLLLMLLVLILAASVGPDLRSLALSLPDDLARVQVLLDELTARNPELASRISGALPSVDEVLGGAAAVLVQAPRLVGVATGLVGGVLYLSFTLILALYLTMDGDRIRRYLIRFLPFERQDQALLLSERIGARLGAWARGEAVLATIIGGLTWVGALVLGLPYAAALALIAAVGELIPNLGPIIAAIPLIAVGLLLSPTQGLLALGLAVLIQQLENNLIVPRVMSQAVDLHPVAVMLAILAGGELLGIAGAILAVPVVAALSVIVDELQRERIKPARTDEAFGMPSGRQPGGGASSPGGSVGTCDPLFIDGN
jgi:predicted PurR-regulated permease PerM